MSEESHKNCFVLKDNNNNNHHHYFHHIVNIEKRRKIAEKRLRALFKLNTHETSFGVVKKFLTCWAITRHPAELSRFDCNEVELKLKIEIEID
jgi:hypothetical protein